MRTGKASEKTAIASEKCLTKQNHSESLGTVLKKDTWNREMPTKTKKQATNQTKHLLNLG